MNSGSPEARFRRLYDRHFEALLGYALRRAQDAGEADDVVAEAFLVLWRRLEDAPADEEIPLWLFGIARNILANNHRTRMRRGRLVDRLGQIANGTVDTEDVVAARWRTRAVINALQQLKQHEREILLLAAWERLSTLEIAAVIGCSENAAAIRLHRARSRLTEVYKKENERSGHRTDERLQLRQPQERRHTDD